MASTTRKPDRIARQQLETNWLMGVPFVPIRAEAAAEDTPPADPEAHRAKAELLEALRAEHDLNCPHCTTAEGHTQTVFGEGSPDADLMFVGEAPGAEEDRTGRPFVGRAGQKLDDMIRAMGLQRQDVYIANVLKTRPPNNRTPTPSEVDRCAPFLQQQIRVIQPSVIMTLGNPSTKFMLQTEQGITKMRGIWGEYRLDDLVIDVMPTYHPAYLLRNYTPKVRQEMWSDLQQVMKKLGLA